MRSADEYVFFYRLFPLSYYTHQPHLLGSCFIHSAPVSLSHCPFACLYLFRIPLCNLLYCCPVFIMSRISSVIYFPPCIVFFGMSSYSDVSKASLNTSHSEFALSFGSLYPLITFSVHISTIRVNLESRIAIWELPWASENCVVFSLRSHITGRRSHRQSTLRYVLFYKTSFLNLFLIVN